MISYVLALWLQPTASCGRVGRVVLSCATRCCAICVPLPFLTKVMLQLCWLCHYCHCDMAARAVCCAVARAARVMCRQAEDKQTAANSPTQVLTDSDSD